ncbi:hypothetical protein BDN71DRAFT_1432917 [Pleurotus eryngii]|uniref:Uncharacterized protein n=1 Tax=Pleurotus eryngii TaxID=5323 RepID=A0A9P5ZSF3_PLEER|nr:hypothetical protein BDN71DRAFT_1432917 [Pleurotus eryngii]
MVLWWGHWGESKEMGDGGGLKRGSSVPVWHHADCRKWKFTGGNSSKHHMDITWIPFIQYGSSGVCLVKKWSKVVKKWHFWAITAKPKSIFLPLECQMSPVLVFCCHNPACPHKAEPNGPGDYMCSRCQYTHYYQTVQSGTLEGS